MWPDGYWRGPDMLQRGNAKLSWFWHGDPLTPGVGATADVARLDPKAAPTLPKIPVVVLSAREATHVLAALGGPERPAAFASGIAGATRVGPGPAALGVVVDMDQGVRPIYDVVASLKGTQTPERAVLLGTHHDAWTFGGVDPGTGTTAMLELARGLGQLAKDGWRPQRTISLAFWDAEEFGLVGSTEYAEAFRAQLQEQLVMYVNIDMYMKGRFDPGGVPSLRAFVADVVKDVPAGNSSVYDQWQQSEWTRLPPSRRAGSVTAFEPDLKPLGSGADFVPFQDHLGVPTMAIEFIGDNGYGYGTYHSNYDSRAYVERVADPGFTQGVLMSRVLGTIALRMAQAELLPFRFSDYAVKLDDAITAAEGWAREAAMPIDVAALREQADGGARRRRGARVGARRPPADRRTAAGRRRRERSARPDGAAPGRRRRRARLEVVPPRVLRLEHLLALRRPAVSRPRRGVPAARPGARDPRRRRGCPPRSIALQAALTAAFAEAR